MRVDAQGPLHRDLSHFLELSTLIVKGIVAKIFLCCSLAAAFQELGCYIRAIDDDS